MQYSNYPDSDSRDAGRFQPADASSPALPSASFSGAYRPAAPPPIDLSSATPVAAGTGAYRPAAPVAPAPPAPATPPAAVQTEPTQPTDNVKQANHWFRGKHIAIGLAVAVVLAGAAFFALRTLNHKTTAEAAKPADAAVEDPAATRSIDENFQRLDADLSAIDKSLAETSGDLAE